MQVVGTYLFSEHRFEVLKWDLVFHGHGWLSTLGGRQRNGELIRFRWQPMTAGNADPDMALREIKKGNHMPGKQYLHPRTVS